MSKYDSTCADLTVFDERSLSSDEPTRPKECCLVQIYPADVVDGMIRLSGTTINIGRDIKCELTISDFGVSRLHARLQLTPQGYQITDLQSTNGTFVNERRVDQELLKGGECLRFGSFIFKFLSADCIEAQYHETVYDAMTRDGLTQAFNKSYLIDNLGYQIARSRRCERPLSVLMMDLDRFKSINDTYGHLVGDEVLKEFCRRISSVTRSDDLLCRYGGEEFSIVLSETTLEGAVELAERCRDIVAATPFSTQSGELAVTVSIGVAELPQSSEEWSPESLLQAADVQLYGAKQSGRNRVGWNSLSKARMI